MSGDEAPRGAGFAPGRHQIEAYGRGGFRFAGMSHRGSIMLLPSGVYAWDVEASGDLSIASLRRVFSEERKIEFMLVGSGNDLVRPDPVIVQRFREAGISLDVMQTGAAARTYNVMLAEDRLVGAALIAVA